MYISRSLQGEGVTLMFLLAVVDVKSQEAAETITANEFKNEDAFLAESTVHVLNEIRGDLVTVAQRITLDPGTIIAARVWIRHRTTPKIQKLE